MSDVIQQFNTPLAMSSQEIAQLVEKRHDNVRRTMDSLWGKGLIAVTQFEEPTIRDLSLMRKRLIGAL